MCFLSKQSSNYVLENQTRPNFDFNLNAMKKIVRNEKILEAQYSRQTLNRKNSLSPILFAPCGT